MAARARRIRGDATARPIHSEGIETFGQQIAQHGFAEQVAGRAAALPLFERLPPQIVPVLQATVSPAEPHQRHQVDLFIPHQANIRIIESVAKGLDLPMDRMFVNVDRYGNTSAASVPVALDEAVRRGAIKSGDLIVLTAFGGGLSWSSAVVRW